MDVTLEWPISGDVESLATTLATCGSLLRQLMIRAHEDVADASYDVYVSSVVMRLLELAPAWVNSPPSLGHMRVHPSEIMGNDQVRIVLSAGEATLAVPRWYGTVYLKA